MLQTLKVNTTDLAVGMYVSGLDRPWLGTPFVIQGFCVENADEIERVISEKFSVDDVTVHVEPH